jgi:PRTRC genetic system protein E
MFKQLSELFGDFTGKVEVSFKNKDNEMSVIVFITPADEKKEAEIKPLQLLGTPEEMDEHFISKLREPFAKTVAFYANTAEVVKSVTEAKPSGKPAYTPSKPSQDQIKKAKEAAEKAKKEAEAPSLFGGPSEAPKPKPEPIPEQVIEDPIDDDPEPVDDDGTNDAPEDEEDII